MPSTPYVTIEYIVKHAISQTTQGSNKKGKAGRVDNLSAPQNAGKVSSTGTVARSKLAKVMSRRKGCVENTWMPIPVLHMTELVPLPLDLQKNKRSAKASKKGAASGSQASDETCPVCKLAVQVRSHLHAPATTGYPLGEGF